MLDIGVGCPNPDCPVVCGTPGSLVHFYSTLRYIAYNDTRNLLEKLVAPNSETSKMMQVIFEDAKESYSRFSRRWPDYDPIYTEAGLEYHRQNSSHSHSTKPLVRDDVAANLRRKNMKRVSTASDPELQDVLDEIGTLLLDMCGGNAVSSGGGLPKCSWEEAMKSYILTFN